MNLSEHNNIYYRIASDTMGNKHKGPVTDNQAWKDEDDAIVFLEAFNEEINRKGECVTEKLDPAMKTAESP